MDRISFQILPTDLLPDYRRQQGLTILENFEKLKESDISARDFSFYTSVSAVFSSKIEGEDIELDSFIKHKLSGVKFLPDYTQKVDDLYATYQFAQNNELNKKHIKQAHKLLTKHILHKSQQGKMRADKMFVITPDGKIEYVACDWVKVKGEMKKLYDDIKLLLNTELDIKEAFFFASLIHLVFVKVHPFYDGNGRTARLLEKWFLAQKLGPKAWFLQSEKLYYDQHNTYYNNIRALGLEYDTLDYSKALLFLNMLPATILTV
ncbi:Fic family protein [Mucilaginibacter sp. AK015]|uniref:Fic family protein n=1 Tax=Mucilaginibacter sp. AK015 TaxID=2723072 RepID=UPI0016201F74|nr:Fic family protein [Mucilaginibacter sp. AK015]MBB5395999.1 Fic family protein [Mucilaginibacter sp. AK015]